MTVLFARSHFSIGESLLTPEDIARLAKEGGYTAAALADTMSISAMVDFTKACKKAEIKPIIGARVRVVNDPLYRVPPKKSGIKAIPNPEWFVDLYMAKPEGFKALTALLSKGFSADQFYYVPRVSLDQVCEALSAGGLIAVASDAPSVFALADYRDALSHLEAATDKREGMGLRVRVTVGNTPLDDRINELALDWAQSHDGSFIVTETALYELATDADTKDVYSAIITNTEMSSRWRPVPFRRDRHVKSFAELEHLTEEAFKRQPKDWGLMASGWQRGLHSFANAIDYVWDKAPISLPKMADDEFNALATLCAKGWPERLLKPVLGYQPPEELLPSYRERLKYELSVIRKLDFSGYFLLVQDLVVWSKNQGIRVGPGRGSVGGSLIAYLIGITDVDPIRFDLLFERFINPDRIDLPDADLDFMSTRRQEVIDYLVEKYGRDYVAGISNYSTLASASALRDAGRMFGLQMFELDCTKLVPKIHGSPVSLDEASEQVPQIAAFKDKHPEIWQHAVRLQDRNRNMGRHAAGVIVAGEPVVSRAVVETRDGGSTVNWDKRYSEDMGLVKLDVLGLKTLDVIDGALQRIKDQTGVDVDPLALSLDDEQVLEAFGRGETAGVFQFESAGMRKLLKAMAVGGKLTFDDLIAAVALYRPGPMDSGVMDDYIAIRQDMKVISYDHPNMKAALESTGGLCIYQEQVMQIARDFAGYSMPDSDKLRKIMGKKLPEEMAKEESKWVDGAIRHSGVTEEFAKSTFRKIETFAAYGFNKSHSAEYAIISFQTMWLKVNHPANFFAASLDLADEDKADVVVRDAATADIFIAPPQINNSTNRFEAGYDPIREQTVILCPFQALKGVSEKGAAAILEGRAKAGGLFKDFNHFKEHTALRLVNIRVQENLRKVGAFASIEPGSLDPRHPDRRIDQVELLPGLIIDAVRVDRKMEHAKHVKPKVIHLINEWRACDGCSLKDRVHPLPALGSKPRFVMVFDCPNWSEDQEGQMMKGKASEIVKECLGEVGLGLSDGYFTSLVKAIKPDEGLNNEHINGCSKWLTKELEILRPPVIIAMGTQTIRHLQPGIKGNANELAGRKIYDKTRDATIICGFHPGQIHHDPSKRDSLIAIFKSVVDLC